MVAVTFFLTSIFAGPFE